MPQIGQILDSTSFLLPHMPRFTGQGGNDKGKFQVRVLRSERALPHALPYKGRTHEGGGNDIMYSKV